ncbi:MAG TPA: glycosyltransferase family 4 protein [Tepidisphaeraceae bacterium]|nr:glycosyltransferase family 4 protein [Tepidisphaeraceae bacterium]
MTVVLINNSQETYTPTRSGAIATWVWEVGRRLGGLGAEALVLSRACEAAAYADVESALIPYPGEHAGRLGRLLGRLERKCFGYTAVGLRSYATRVVEVVRARSLSRFPLVVHNDLELAVRLRHAFPNSTVVHHFHNQSACKPRFLREVVPSGVRLSAVSDFTARWAERRLGLSSGSVTTVHNGVDADRFTPRAGIARRDRAVINFVGRTGIEKGPDLLLEAAKRLAAQGARFDVQLLGSNYWHKFELDGYQRKLQTLASELEDAGVRVRRPGHVPRADLPAEITRADIHVTPSRWDEPFGLVTLEGMACGLATVASRTGGTPEVVGDAGLMFERDDVGGLAAALGRLIDNPAERAALGRSARRRAETFTWDATARGVLAVAGLEPARAVPSFALAH